VKLDKEIIIGFCLCGVLIIAWGPLSRYMGWEPQKPPAAPAGKQQPAVVKPAETGKPAKTSPAKTEPENKSESASTAAKKVSIMPAQKIKGESSSLVFNPNKGVLEKLILLKYFQEDHKTPIELTASLPPGALAVFGDKEWHVDEILDNSTDSAAKSYKLVRKMSNGIGGQFTLTQRWQLVSDYILTYSVSIKNNGKSELRFPSLMIQGASLLPFSILTDDPKINRESDTIDYCTANGSLESIDTDDDEKDFFAAVKGKIHWCGSTNKYLATLVLAEKPFDELTRKRVMVPETKTHKEYYIAALGGSYKDVLIPPEAEKTFDFKCYNGPKIISYLTEFDQKAPEIMNLSWGPIGWIAGKFLSFLIFLKDICGSYGWSIIIITVIVRLLFWPITQKANKSMKRMQKVQPQMKEIREKYKDDPQTMNAKVMELYRKEKVNPLGGCLPILLQIPVFFALYSTLNGAVELRQVPFWWISDLAKPDTVAVIFGLAINPLIIVMTGLMVLQQRLTPAAMDPTQQKMMMFMPLIMLVMLYNLPGGLTLYWTVSQVLSILQLMLQKKLDSEENKSVKKAV
jgi:YidC/Oxa1 family membrane protein insertase